MTLMAQWRLSAHAVERMTDRGITRDQVEAVLDRPSTTMPDPKRTGCRMYVGGGVVAVVDEVSREVITVGIHGAAGNDWVEFAPPPAAPLVEPPVAVTPADVARRSSSARRRTAAAEAAVCRNVLDDVHPQIASTVRRLLRQRGLDFRAVRVCSPTDVRISV